MRGSCRRTAQPCSLSFRADWAPVQRHPRKDLTEDLTRSLTRFVLVLTAVFNLLVCDNATAGELVVNGTFETGDFGPAWVHGAYRGGNNNPNLADHVVVADLPYSGASVKC